MFRWTAIVTGLLIASVAGSEEGSCTLPEASDVTAADGENTFLVTVELVELDDAVEMFAFRHEDGILDAAGATQLRELAEIGDGEMVTFSLTVKPGESARLLPDKLGDSFSMLAVHASGEAMDPRPRVSVDYCLDHELPSHHEYRVGDGECLLLPRAFVDDDCAYLTTLHVKSLPSERDPPARIGEPSLDTALPVIHGTVRDEAGRPLSGVTVSMSDHGRYRFFSPATVTDQNGEYRFEVEVGFGLPHYFDWQYQVRIRVEHSTLVSTEWEHHTTWLPGIPGAIVRKDIVLRPAEE